MTTADVQELHNITPIQNLPSILAHGIVSYTRAQRLPHQSVAMSAVQAKRAKVQVPGGLKLHDYANLYFHARNPMMYVRRGQHASLCVLRVDPQVLHLPGVVIADCNASSAYCRFAASPAGLANVDGALVFARYWTHHDEMEQYRRKSIKCAEVLVPQSVAITHVTGVYVSCAAAEQAVQNVASGLPVAINRDLFFQ